MAEVNLPKWQGLIDAFAQKSDTDQVELLSALTLERCFEGNVPLDVTVREIARHLQTPLNVLDTLNATLDQVQGDGPITDANKRLDAIFETPDAGAAQVNLLRLVSAYLGHLTNADLAAWAEDDKESVDGLLREIVRMGHEARTVLLGEPDCPVCGA